MKWGILRGVPQRIKGSVLHFFIILFIYLYILAVLGLHCFARTGAILCRHSPQTSHCGGFPCGARAPGTQASRAGSTQAW